METTRSNREHILDVAERMFSSRGYANVSINEICRESGLPVGSIYHHFTNKLGLLTAVFERASSMFFDDIPDPNELSDDPCRRLVEYYESAAHVIGARVLFMRLMFLLRLQEGQDDSLAALVRESHRRVQAELAVVIEAAARSCGVSESADLANELAELTVSSTAGIVVFSDPDATGFTEGIVRLGQLVLAAIREHAASRSVARC